MNEKKIAVIVQLQSEGQDFFEALGLLNIPEGYKVDVIAIEHGRSRAAAYQEAMEQSDAKYKVYMDEAARILNGDFFADMLKIFHGNANIGAIGTSGTKGFLSDGWYENAYQRAGKCCRGYDFQEMAYDNEAETKESWQEVIALDEFFLATQRDVHWRNDLFQEGGTFSVTAQCLELRRQGYKCAVPQQGSVWVADLLSARQPEKSNQQIFLQEYAKDILPLVSVVIPTYNRPEYFKEALDSVLAQTYRNLDIFVTDNSSNEDTAELMRDYTARDKRIKYEHHPEYVFIDNWRRAAEYDNPAAEYVSWLMDDDMFMPQKIAAMVDAYLLYPQVSLVTSYRQIMNEHSEVQPDLPATRPLCERTELISGFAMGREMLQNQMNYIGEPTTVLMKKELLRSCPFGTWEGLGSEYLLFEFPTWCYLLTRGDLMYIREPLSRFRVHSGNGQWRLDIILRAYILWSQSIKFAWEKKAFLTTREEYGTALRNWLGRTMGEFPVLWDRFSKYTRLHENDEVLQRIVTDICTEVAEDMKILNQEGL